jgi:hypothetical protein
MLATYFSYLITRVSIQLVVNIENEARQVPGGTGKFYVAKKQSMGSSFTPCKDSTSQGQFEVRFWVCRVYRIVDFQRYAFGGTTFKR